MNRERVIQMIASGERMLEIADGASTAWDAVKAGKTFSELAGKTAVGAEAVAKKGSLGVTLAIVGIFVAAAYGPGLYRLKKGT